MNNTNKKIQNLNNRVNQLQQQLKKKSQVNVAKKANIANFSSSSSASQKKVKRHVVSQTERVGTLLASGSPDYSVTSVSINPGTSFPWLSTQAKLYDKYRFTKLVFKFKTSGPTINFGSVGLGFDYNPLSGNPLTSEDFSQLTVWKLQSAWENFSINVDVNRRILPYLYTRKSLIGGTDLKTYDIGRLYFVHEGIPSTVTSGTLLGYIEADYTVELIDKQPDLLSNNLSAGLVSASNKCNNSTVTGSSATTHYFTLSPMTWLVNNLDLSSASNIGGPATTFTGSLQTLTLSPGVYSISVSRNATNAGTCSIVDSSGTDYFSSTAPDFTMVITLAYATRLALRLVTSSAVSPTYQGDGIKTIVVSKL